MAHAFKTLELSKAWERAPCGHFFDDIDTVLRKLKTPHPDELSRIYENDERNIDPLSPVNSDDEDDDDWEDCSVDEEADDRMTIEDNLVLEQLKQFDYIDIQFLERCSSSDIYDCVTCQNQTTNIELCPDEFARYYDLEVSELRNRKCFSDKTHQKFLAKRLSSLLYDLDGSYRNQLYSLLAYYLKHKFSTYKALLQDYLNGDINKGLFEKVLGKLFTDCTNSFDSNNIFDLHNEFMLSLWPSAKKEDSRKEQQLQAFCDIDLKFYAKLYQYQKRKRTKALFSDLFHTEVPEFKIQDEVADQIEFSIEVDNLQISGSTKHQRCPTSFLNTKFYIDKFWQENNQQIPNPDAKKQTNQQLEKQMCILEKLWLTELTQAYGIEFGMDSFEKYNITQRRFASWFKAQIKHFQLQRTHSKNGHEVKFIDLRIHTPTECDEDYCPILFSLRKLPVDKVESFLCASTDRKLLCFRGLQMRFNRTIGKDMKKNKILFVDKRAVEVCQLALLKFMKNVIQELVRKKPNFRNINKKFDRYRVIDGIVPKAKAEYYSDLTKEINAKSLDDILLTEEGRKFSQNLFYHSMLENEHFDIAQNPINDLDLLAALQNSQTLIPNRIVWQTVKQRLISKLSQTPSSSVSPMPLSL